MEGEGTLRNKKEFSFLSFIIFMGFLVMGYGISCYGLWDFLL